MNALMRRAIYSLSVNATFLVLLYFGFFGDVQGARHVVVFTVWVLNLPAGILIWSDDDVQRKLAENAELPAVCLFVRLVVQYATLGVLVWCGYIVTAIAWVVWMICARSFRNRVRQLRAEYLNNQGKPDAA